MGAKLLNGLVESLSGMPDSEAAECQLGGSKIYLHRDIAQSVRNGDNVFISGLETKDGLRALAVNNTSLKKIDQIDCTNHILLFGLGFVLTIMLGVFGLQGSSGVGISAVEDVVALAGAALAVVSVRSTLRIIKATNSVRNAGY